MNLTYEQYDMMYEIFLSKHDNMHYDVNFALKPSNNNKLNA